MRKCKCTGYEIRTVFHGLNTKNQCTFVSVRLNGKLFVLLTEYSNISSGLRLLPTHPRKVEGRTLPSTSVTSFRMSRMQLCAHRSHYLLYSVSYFTI